MELLLIIEDMNQEHMKKNVTMMSKGGDKKLEDHDDHEHKEGGEKMELLLDHSWIMMNLNTTLVIIKRK